MDPASTVARSSLHLLLLNLSLFIARRYMAAQKGGFSSFIIRLAIVATSLSVAVMIMALAVVSGFKEAISDKLFSFMGHVQVRTYNQTGAENIGFSEPIYADPVLKKQLSGLEHVQSVAPFVMRPSIAQANGLLENIQLKGVDESYRFGPGIRLSGSLSFSDSAYSKDILLSRTIADRMNVKQGDTVQVNFFVGGESPLRIRRLRVAGTYHSGMEEMDKYYALCDIRLLQRIAGWSADSINGFQLTLDNAIHSDDVAANIHFNLIEPPMAVYTTVETVQFIFDWLAFQGVNSTVLIIIMTIVAVINLGAALLILIVDRAPMIGLLKALGMPYDSMRNIFLGISGIVAGLGILFGNILALGMCFLQLNYGIIKLPEASYYMQYAPIKVIWWQVLAVDAGTLVLCIFCMWLPTLYIRRVQPARVLQFR